MIKQNIKSSQKNEKGIALIFSLIFLSLLLILALAFALDSMFDQKAAYNSANANSAGLLARAQLNQIMTLIERNAANYDDEGKLYSHDATPGTDYVEHTDMLADRLRSDVDSSGTATWFANIRWNYIRNNSTGAIVARTAFVVVPDDKLPLNSLVDGRIGTTDYPKHNEANYTETRIGKYVSEINVQSVVNSSTAADVMNWKEDTTLAPPRPGFPNGKYTGTWSSYDDLIETINANIDPDLTTTQEDSIRNKLSITVNEEREAFWADENNDGVWDSGEYYARFNLARTDWTKSTWEEDLDFLKKDILLVKSPADTAPEPTAPVTVPVAAMQDWADNNNDVYGLPWIACFGLDGTGANMTASDLGNFSSVYDQRCQIAANLKDYCDSDSRPTSDVNPADWASGTSVPAFTGNEKTPYINKVGLRFEVSRGISGSGSYEYWAHIDVTPHVELINIFDTAFDSAFLSTLKIKVTGTFIVDYIDKGKAITRSANVEFTAIEDVAAQWPTGTGYKFFELTSNVSYEANKKPGVIVTSLNLPTNASGDSYYSHSTSDTESVTVNIREAKIEKVVLYDASIGYDYVKTLTKATDLSGVFDGNSGYTYCWFGWSVHDPRQNLNENDWKRTGADISDDATKVLAVTGSTGGPYAGGPNDAGVSSGVIYGPSEAVAFGDTEGGNDPSDGNLSTAYIKNAPMESPWELGCIHRGKMWQTLNLGTYNSSRNIQTFNIGTPARYYIAGGGMYSDGDANILDQIKMTAEPKSPEKINLRSQSDSVLTALFDHVNEGGAFGTVSAMAAGTAINAVTYKDAVKGKYPTSPISNMYTRASVVDVLVPSGATNDAMREEIIGKIVNLTKIEALGGSGFTVYILAQTIKDIGGVGSTINIRKYSEDETPGDRDCEIGVFDADTSNADSKKHIYFDEITAEQKIKVRGIVSGGKVKITSFQYID